MASTLPPVRGATFNFPISLVSQADTDIFKTTVTITTADVWVSKDGGAFAAVTAAPVELETGAAAKTGVLWQNLTATEMTADLVTVLYHDAAGSEWQDALVFIQTGAQTLDTTDGVVDGISAVKPAYTPTVAATGEASANVTSLAGQTEPVDNLVLALGTGGLVEKLNSALEAAGLAYRFTAEALAEAPTGGSAGSGTGTYTDTIKEGATPLDGVRVQLSTDDVGSNRVYEAYTNALGVFTMNPDPGTYYRWLDLAGYDFAQGVAVVVT